jgi:hypothetical protein
MIENEFKVSSVIVDGKRLTSCANSDYKSEKLRLAPNESEIGEKLKHCKAIDINEFFEFDLYKRFDSKDEVLNYVKKKVIEKCERILKDKNFDVK